MLLVVSFGFVFAFLMSQSFFTVDILICGIAITIMAACEHDFLAKASSSTNIYGKKMIWKMCEP